MDRGGPPRRNRQTPNSQQSRPQSSATRGRHRPTHGRPPHSRRSPPPSTSAPSQSPSTRPQPSAPRNRPPRSKNRQRQRRPTPSIPSVAIKLAVRRLPPALPASQFAKVADEKGASCAVWRSYLPGSIGSFGPVKRTPQVVRHSVAYLAFATMNDAISFCDQMNGYCFSDASSPSSPSSLAKTAVTTATYTACVERALYQSTPPFRRRAPSPAQGTIEQDNDYQAFLKALENGEAFPAPGSTSTSLPSTSLVTMEKDVSIDDKKLKGRAKSQIVTPLMEIVRQRRREKDQRKKASKQVVRTVRPKGRQIHIVDPPKSVVDTSKANGRRKKRRGFETSTHSRRGDMPSIVERRGGPSSGKSNVPDRSTNSFSRHDDISLKGATSGITISSKSPSSPFVKNATFAHVDGSESSAKNDINGTSARPRYSRTPRARGNKYNSVPANGVIGRGPSNDHGTKQDSMHGSVRLLKKEASNGSKT